MTVISWAVEALCRALAPGLAKETLPTRTLWTTVLLDGSEGGGTAVGEQTVTTSKVRNRVTE